MYERTRVGICVMSHYFWKVIFKRYRLCHVDCKFTTAVAQHSVYTKEHKHCYFDMTHHEDH